MSILACISRASLLVCRVRKKVAQWGVKWLRVAPDIPVFPQFSDS
jgi:hypothetical protein